MEGISHEVCSLAGTLQLGKLIAYYDDNGISIDGEVEGWFSDDTEERFKSYGWQVLRVDTTMLMRFVKQQLKLKQKLKTNDYYL